MRFTDISLGLLVLSLFAGTSIAGNNNQGSLTKKKGCPWKGTVPKLSDNKLIGDLPVLFWQQCGRRCRIHQACKTWRFENNRCYLFENNKKMKNRESAPEGALGGGQNCPAKCLVPVDPTCNQGEMVCGGFFLKELNRCEGDRTCVPSQTSGKDGAVCPGFCPVQCAEGKKHCVNIDPNTGCSLEETCINATTTDAEGRECPRHCSPICRDGEMPCSGPEDGQGCPGQETCQPARAPAANPSEGSTGDECEAYCPRTKECPEGNVLCDGFVNSMTGCRGQPYCAPECLDE